MAAESGGWAAQARRGPGEVQLLGDNYESSKSLHVSAVTCIYASLPLVEATERRQIRTGEGSVRHVEVFRLGGVGTPIIGRETACT